jgi:hypothetical protein
VLNRLALAGQQPLADGRQAGLDGAIDRDDFTGVADHNVVCGQGVEVDLDLDPVSLNPDPTGVASEDLGQISVGVALGPPDDAGQYTRGDPHDCSEGQVALKHHGDEDHGRFQIDREEATFSARLSTPA